jgi:maltose alpha-D-glucosyltransferase / alpha-amylase
LRALRGSSSDPLYPTPSRAEQSNSSVIFGERLMLKLYRRLEAGVNPDVEVGTFLTDRRFPHAPQVGGWVEYRPARGESATSALVQAYVPNEGDLWEFTLDALGDFLERAVATTSSPDTGSTTAASLLRGAEGDIPETARESIGAYLDTAGLVGERTAELHSALASDPDDPEFAPEPFTALYQRSLYQSIQSTVRQSLRLLARRAPDLPDETREEADAVIALAPVVEDQLRGLLAERLTGMRIRCHGDYHAGQVLYTGRDVVIIDFEGEPARPLSERRLKRSPLTDVAGMIRSFHYAANEALLRARRGGSVRPQDAATLDAWARHWYAWVAAAFLRGYRRTVGGAPFVPAEDREWAVLLDALLMQKAFYELGYEMNNRPDWLGIPLKGIVSLLTP